jgi:hypothetical protein
MFKPYIFTLCTSISHNLIILKPIPVIFVRLDAPRKELQILFNIQRLLTNVKKIIKLYLQMLFTYLSTYHIKITICFFLTNTLQTFYPIFFTQKGIPIYYMKKIIHS